MSPWVNFFSESLIFSPTTMISCKIFISNDFLKVFPIQMHWRPMLTLSYNRSRSSQGHDLYIHCRTLAMDASCKVSLKSVNPFQKRFFKGFYHIWAWQPSW